MISNSGEAYMPYKPSGRGKGVGRRLLGVGCNVGQVLGRAERLYKNWL